MARKQNGFGSFKAPSISNRVDIGKVKGAAGSYPSDRSYGSTLLRTIIEHYNMSSDWVKWRKGMEYYYGTAWSEIENAIESSLYQGTANQIDVRFTGYRFATESSDDANHYVLKRSTVGSVNLGQVVSLLKDPAIYSDNFKRRELWAQIQNGSTSLRHMIGERITDDTTEATIRNVLTSNKHPAVYVGKTSPTKQAEVKVTVPLSEITASSFYSDNNNDVQAFVGKLGYIENFFTERAINNSTEVFADDLRTFKITSVATASSQGFQVLDQNLELPPSLYDITDLTPLFNSSNAGYSLTGEYIFDKDAYQRFFGQKYLTAAVVEADVTDISYTVMPFTIKSVLVVGNNLEFTSVPYQGEIKVYAPVTNGHIIFADYSFIKHSEDSYNGVYYHQDERNQDRWERIETDVDPWQDEVFTGGSNLKPATIYSCSCPNYSRSVIRIPESETDDGKSTNRQQRYPLPTVMGRKAFEDQGLKAAAGLINSWETEAQKAEFKICKHTIAARFIERIKVQEPNQYPTLEARQAFEKKLKEDMERVGAKFRNSLRREGITTLELIHSLAQGLNLDDVEAAYVLLNSLK